LAKYNDSDTELEDDDICIAVDPPSAAKLNENKASNVDNGSDTADDEQQQQQRSAKKARAATSAPDSEVEESSSLLMNDYNDTNTIGGVGSQSIDIDIDEEHGHFVGGGGGSIGVQKRNDFLWSPEPDRYNVTNPHEELELAVADHFNSAINEAAEDTDATAAAGTTKKDANCGQPCDFDSAMKDDSAIALGTNTEIMDGHGRTKSLVDGKMIMMADRGDEDNLEDSDAAQYDADDGCDEVAYDDEEGTSIVASTPRAVKYLCITSIFFVLCSLGLAAAGLGMMYTAKNNNQGDDAAAVPVPNEIVRPLAPNDFDMNLVAPPPTDDSASDDNIVDMDDELNPKARPDNPIVKSCIYPNHDTCGKGDFCMIAPGECPKRGTTVSGICTNKPEMCATNFDPVCGCDRETYSNSCDAANAGASVKKEGECSARLTEEPTAGSPSDIPSGGPTSSSPSEDVLGSGLEFIPNIPVDTTTTAATEAAADLVTVANMIIADTNSTFFPVIEIDTEITASSPVPDIVESTIDVVDAVITSPATTTQAADMANSTTSTNVTTTSSTRPANVTTTSSSPKIYIPSTLLSTIVPTIADTWLDEPNADLNFGDKKRLKVDGLDPRATLLKFNLTSLDISANDIVGVSLRLYSLTYGPFGGKIDLLGNDCNTWDEFDVTWNNAPSCVFQNNSELVGQYSAIPEHVWNEAILYFSFPTPLPELITLRVTSHYADGVTYASRENGTAVPELMVYYTEPVPTASPTESVPSKSPTVKPTSSPEIPVPTTGPTGMPSYNPTTGWPTYSPTSSSVPTITPTMNGTKSPTISPSVTPKDTIMLATQDAMIRGGEFSNYRHGKDPFVSLYGTQRKVLLEFDLSGPLSHPNFDYLYTLQFYVTFVSRGEQRSVTASYITQADYGWNEDWITWNTFGTPNTTEIGWFSIFNTDEESLVQIPLGSLRNSTVKGDKLILVLENSSRETSSGGGDKFDFRSSEFQGMPDTPPTLFGVPQLE